MQLKIGYGLAEIGTLAKVLFVVGIVLAVTLLSLSKMRDQLDVGTAEFNALNDIITEVIGLVGWIGVIVVIYIGVMLYGYSNALGGGKKR